MKFYFVSKQSFHNEILHPRVPITCAKGEEKSTPRICVSPSINGCLSATGGRYKENDELYVHSCETDNYYQPTLDEVPDCIYTGEFWIQHPIEMKFHSWIKVTNIYPLSVHGFLSEAVSFDVLAIDKNGILNEVK